MAQKVCCGRVCHLCESPAEYAWRRRTVDLAQLVNDAVKEDLTQVEREVIEKYWFENRTLTKIAAETGKAAPNVARILDRAHKKLFSVLHYVVKYQHNLESVSFTPLAVRKALAVAAAAQQHTDTLGERIKSRRLSENIPLPVLAKALTIPANRMSSIEMDKISPNAEEIIKFAAFFNMTTDELLKGRK